MDLDAYQRAAARTTTPKVQGLRLMQNAALGMAGESGEVCDLLKKHLFHDHPLDQQKLMKECGDVLWYVAAMATALGVSLSDIAQMNIDKLRLRYPEGFSAEKSKNRKAEDV